MAKITGVRFFDEEGRELTEVNDVKERTYFYKGTIHGGKVSGGKDKIDFNSQTILIGKKRYRFLSENLCTIAVNISNVKFGNTDSNILISPSLDWANRELSYGHSVCVNAKDSSGYLVTDTLNSIQGNFLIGEKLTYKISE